MAIYRYLVSVDIPNPTYHSGVTLQGELDANLESVILDYGIEHFTIEPVTLSGYLDYRERVIRSNES